MLRNLHNLINETTLYNRHVSDVFQGKRRVVRLDSTKTLDELCRDAKSWPSHRSSARAAHDSEESATNQRCTSKIPRTATLLKIHLRLVIRTTGSCYYEATSIPNLSKFRLRQQGENSWGGRKRVVLDEEMHDLQPTVKPKNNRQHTERLRRPALQLALRPADCVATCQFSCCWSDASYHRRGFWKIPLVRPFGRPFSAVDIGNWN